MLKRTFCATLLLLVAGCINTVTAQSEKGTVETADGKLEKMIVENGSVTLDVDLSGLNGKRSRGTSSALRFTSEQNSFFTILVFNGELRGPVPSAMPIVPQNTGTMPAKLRESFGQLMIENMSWGGQFDLAIRDSKSGFTFFNIDGAEYTFDAQTRNLKIDGGRVLVSREFAAAIGRPNDAGTVIGKISMNSTMRTIEVTEFANGETKSESLPSAPNAGTVPGPDVVVGDVNGLAQFGSSVGTQVGLSLGTDSCNYGTVDLNWFQLPSNDHPVIPQNLYRMSANTDRFEQVGQSQLKHAFTALTNNICGLGCNGVGGTRLGSGCSDPYTASLNASQNGLGSKAWVNPFTGAFPRGDSPTNPNNHSGHAHSGPTHRILVEISDLSTALNAGATYYAEGQYVTPHEYAWCQANPTQCNMNNNVSYRQYTVNGTGSPFTFSTAGATQRQKAAITAWSGATLVTINPAPGVDGIGTVGYKVTNPSPGVWHYEYAIYNQNLDRAIQSFSVPVGNGANVSNVGFHAPPQHPGNTGDGTLNDAGFSSTAWTSNLVPSTSMTWASETFAQNPNANAVRWGTLYNYRFDSNQPPTTVTATIGFFKTGSPITVQVQGPSPVAQQNVSVGGRVADSNGRPGANVRVTLTNPQGVTLTTRTNSFGLFQFNGVQSNVAYTLRADFKGITIAPVVVTPTASVFDADLIGTNSN